MRSKEQIAEYNKRYRVAHKEHYAELKREWNKNNKVKYTKYKYEWQNNNKGKVSTYCKKWYINNPDKAKNRTLKNRYGITLDDYNIMFTRQQGRCWICGIHASELKVPLQVDHSHITGIVRGLLCGLCNSRLDEGNIGHFNGTDMLYSKALGYITLYNN